MKNRLPLSVVLISFNEEENIGRTLEAVKDTASEIIVVDSDSTDSTAEIAESYGAKVFKEDWKGHVAQRIPPFPNALRSGFSLSTATRFLIRSFWNQ